MVSLASSTALVPYLGQGEEGAVAWLRLAPSDRLCWLVTSSARSETSQPPHRGRLITECRDTVLRGSVHGSVPSF